MIAENYNSSNKLHAIRTFSEPKRIDVRNNTKVVTMIKKGKKAGENELEIYGKGRKNKEMERRIDKNTN